MIAVSLPQERPASVTACRLNSYKNEAEGTRTLNLRIDSLIVVFVSACQQTINNGEIKTYESGREPTETLKSAS
jgi:hypothetical protein